MSKRNQKLGEWTIQTYNRAIKTLEKIYGERSKDGMFDVKLDVSDSIITKEQYSKDTITSEELYGELIPEIFEVEISKLILKISDDLLDRVYRNSPNKFRMDTTARKHGFSIPDVFLDIVYELVNVIVDGYDLCERSNIKLI